MMRILLVTEGPSDEPVAERLVRRVFHEAEIHRKRFTARGISVVTRQLETWIRAAHFGRYDLLVVHFDLDDSLPAVFQNVSESQRWKDLSGDAERILASLPEIGRAGILRIAFMAPCQSTEAWLAWGRENKDGARWEKENRHGLKRRLFGDPPRGLIAKSEKLSEELVAQMSVNEDWPRSLRSFFSHLGDG